LRRSAAARMARRFFIEVSLRVNIQPEFWPRTAAKSRRNA
jgi:hypothetical protein